MVESASFAKRKFFFFFFYNRCFATTMTSSHVEISTESRNLPLMPRFYRITAVILRAQSASKADEIIVIPLPTFPTE